MAKISFAKPALTIPQQVTLLQERGLVVADAQRAAKYLKFMGYYRLSGYMLPYQNGGTGEDRHQFADGTDIEEIIDLYVFDRKLRLLFLDAIERIEIALRAALSTTMSLQHGPHWYLNAGHFEAWYDHANFITKAKAENRIDKQLIDAAVAKDVAVQLRDMIATAPASQGVIGWMRGTAQNVIATGGELGRYFGGNVDAIQKRIAQGLEEQELAGSFDKNIPAIELMSNMLAFQYAKLQGADRLSNEMIRTARSALGLEGMTSNQQSSLARLDQAIKMIESQEAILGNARKGGVDAVGGSAPPGPPPTTMESGAAPERWERRDGRMVRVQ